MLTNSQRATENLAAMISSLTITSDSCKLGSETIEFSGPVSDYEELISRSLAAALELIPYHDILDIALDMQQRDMLARGLLKPPMILRAALC